MSACLAACDEYTYGECAELEALGPDFLITLQKARRQAYDELTEEQKQAMVEVLEAHREKLVHGPRISQNSRSQDVTHTVQLIENLVKFFPPASQT